MTQALDSLTDRPAHFESEVAVPEMNALHDAVSDVLGLVRLRTELVCESEAGAPWSVRFKRPGSHLHIVRDGEAWLIVDGDDTPKRLTRGDLIVLPHGGAHVLCSDPSVAPMTIERAITEDASRDGMYFHMGSPDVDTRLLCARFFLSGVLATRLLGVLPNVIALQPASDRSLNWLPLTSTLLEWETRDLRAGSAIAIARLLELLFVQAVREWAASGPAELGWLSGLRDAHVGRALAAMHEEPAKNWTVENLADVARLSRSAFAARFTTVVGETPLRYLATWRLDLAADQLRAGTTRIEEIGRGVGYGSEASFTRAFKAQFGETPGAFRSSASLRRARPSQNGSLPPANAL